MEDDLQKIMTTRSLNLNFSMLDKDGFEIWGFCDSVTT